MINLDKLSKSIWKYPALYHMTEISEPFVHAVFLKYVLKGVIRTVLSSFWNKIILGLHTIVLKF